jgi:DNA-binding transcriptional regulator PaaX
MKYSREIKSITYGIIGNTIDLILWQFFLVGASFGKSGPQGVSQAFYEADQMLVQINHKTFLACLSKLSRKRLLRTTKRKNIYNTQITKFGIQRLKQILPRYQKIRPWDNKVYLITYDVPEKYHNKRNRLRRFLLHLGCKLFQESVFITLYNPRELINQFVKKYNIPGTIIVSDIGKDGGIGEEIIQDVLIKLYSLENINDKYKKFLINADTKTPVNLLLFEYLSILKEDPQLPFEILPKNWLGHKAYQCYQKLLHKFLKPARAGRF